MDEESTEALLADLSAEQREDIRQAVSALTDVSADEVQDVSAELLMASTNTETADEMFPAEVLSLSPISTGDASHCLPVSNNDTRDVLGAVLQKTSGEALHRVLRDEYPQTLAVIVSRMPPDEAAKFLAELNESKRADVMRRIADMDSTDIDVVEDVCAELSHLVDTELSEIDGSLVGRDAVKAILFAARGEHRSQLIASIAAGDPRLAVQLGVTAEAGTLPHAIRPNGGTSSQHWNFDRFLSLEARLLAPVIRSADTEIVLLALIGASPDQIDHVLSGLHASEGSSIRRHLSAIGPVRLRDIEYAQMELVQSAQRMHRDGSECGSSRAQGLTLSV